MSKTRQQYHHGALRDALLHAALKILADDGLDALSLRAIARAVGVSQTAPYSHFKNRSELLAAVAQQGFERLLAAMHKAQARESAGSTRVLALGRSYIRFASQNPALYSLMFSNEFHNMADYPQLAETATKSYAVIDAAVSEHLGEAAAQAGTLAAWALVHGLADLIQRGRLSPPPAAAAQRRFIEDILKQLF